MANKIGIIGGSGLDNPDLLKEAVELQVDTPYGKPSSPLTCGVLNDTQVVMIARHGHQHQFSPTQVNYRANIAALRDQEVTHILATTACGSLRSKIERGDFVILDQFIDFTKHRINTFHDTFEAGAVHTAMAEPFDSVLRRNLFETAQSLGYETHNGGTVVTIEGPRFSTRAESFMFRAWGADVINMSIAPEAALANEAEIPYAAVAMSTDYDCWKTDEAPVTWEEILAVFNHNAHRVTQLISEVITRI